MPQADEALRDATLEVQVATARKIVALGLTLREQERIGVRRPLATLTVACRDAGVREAAAAFQSEIAAELNIKAVEIVEDDGDLVELSAKANFKVLGRRLGKKMKVVAAAIAKLDRETVAAVQDGGEVEVEGETLGADDFLFVRAPKEGMVVGSQDGITVVLDTKISDALLREGLARELVNRVQNLRKSSGLEVSDRIRLRASCPGGSQLAATLADAELSALLCAETLAEDFSVLGEGEAHLEAQAADEIEGESITLSLEALQ
jgi:isoleucyl-tRNA synthetase